MKTKELIEKLNNLKKQVIEIRDMHRLVGDVSYSTYMMMSDAILKEIDEIINSLKV